LKRNILFALLALAAAAVNAQTFTVLKSLGMLSNMTGTCPYSPLVQGPDGTLYGTTSSGEGSLAGTVFKVRPDGSGFSVLKCFSGAAWPAYLDGMFPHSGLVLNGGTLYGTTASGGLGCGTVFKVNTDGTGYIVLKNFASSD